MKFTRSSGILLHPTSFPGRYGIGDLGEEAYRFVDFLDETGQTLWQIMPLGPTGYGDSPYASFSAFAGNPLLISPDLLAADNYLSPEDLAEIPSFPTDKVDFGPVIDYKKKLLARSFHQFEATATAEAQAYFGAFCRAKAAWLDDFALFMALKEHFGGVVWNSWATEIASHQPEALAEWRTKLATEVRYHSYLQYQFHCQWSALKRYANQHGVKLIGDIPIFVAFDSADVWSHPDLFYLDKANNPAFMAGVPPDYFCETGQLWGNPLYRWKEMGQQNYSWWVERFRQTLELVDIARIDHFRGFDAYWAVPAGEETAIKGKWLKGPGAKLFKALQQQLGDLPIIAEDLGLITPTVAALRNQFGFPGMKVLQFGFGGNSTEAFLPHNFERNCVVYTGTHDNDTTQGWFKSILDHERTNVQLYLGRDGTDIAWDLIRVALSSVADIAIVPLQDILNLGAEGRMNTPGQAGGNWGWRYPSTSVLDLIIRDRLATLTQLYSRNPIEVAKLNAEKEEQARLEFIKKGLLKS
ncbi:MAG: 4-alpha-glucanotransferase [Chloroflexota bacterium]|nr:4-alpha-glucanotransferase [Chloroflexota bacterium]